jgi:hypothetical protein
VVLADDPFGVNEFDWGVCTAGYEWRRRCWSDDWLEQTNRHQYGHVLFARGDGFQKLTHPLHTPALFRELAAARADQVGIKAFADTHGPLGLCVRSWKKGRKRHPSHWGGEALDSWRHQIIVLRSAVRIWDAMQARDPGQLRHVFMLWSEIDPATKKLCEDWNIERDKDTWLFLGREDDERPCLFRGLMDTPRPDQRNLDRWTAARRMLVEGCNLELQHHCCPYVRQRSTRGENYSIAMKPKNLLGAVWLQFSRLVTGEASIGRCSVCGTQIEHSRDGEGFRADKVFCTNACKMKRARERIRTAKAMRAEGKTITQIAKHFGRKPEKIEKWLARKM